VRANGADQVAAGMVAWVAVMMDLLGRIIGEETAVRLVEQTAIPSPRGVVSTESEGGRDG
jgi:transcriptional regulator GlxA family with amidase domain